MALMTLSSSSPTTTTIISLPKPLSSSSSSSSSSLMYIQHSSPKRNKCQSFKIQAKLGGGEEDITKNEKKKFITREQEPEQYWQSAGERAGENPMKTPLPYIIIFGMSTPFVILAIGFVQGWIKVPIR